MLLEHSLDNCFDRPAESTVVTDLGPYGLHSLDVHPSVRVDSLVLPPSLHLERHPKASDSQLLDLGFDF